MEFVQNFLDIGRWVSFFNALALPITALSDFFFSDIPTLVSWINPTNLLPNLVTAISSGFSSLGASISSGLSALGTEIYDGVTDMLVGISSMLDGVVSFFVNVWEAITTFISNIFGGGIFTWGGGGFAGGGGGAR